MSEIRYSEVVASAPSSRLLEGTVMRYGSLAQLPDGRLEKFRAGAFGDVASRDIILNSMHLRPFPLARVGAGLKLIDSDSMLNMQADLSKTEPGRQAYEQVQAGILRGLSVEFTALEERQAGNVREIIRASLDDLGLVDRPAYETSTVEARARTVGRAARRLTTLRGAIPAGKVLACRCSPGRCKQARFKRGSLDDAVDDPAEGTDVLAVIGEYSRAIGSQRRGSLRFWSDGRGGLEFAADVFDNARGRQFLDTFNSVDTFARPSLDLSASIFEEVNDGVLAVYQAAKIRAMVLGPTDYSDGWEPLRVRRSRDDDKPTEERTVIVTPRRRVWL